MYSDMQDHVFSFNRTYGQESYIARGMVIRLIGN